MVWNHIDRLREYVRTLEARIELEEKALHFVTPIKPLHGGPGTSELAALAREEPIRRTIKTYQDAKDTLYQLFPELKE